MAGEVGRGNDPATRLCVGQVLAKLPNLGAVSRPVSAAVVRKKFDGFEEAIES
jgi:hypothetical protein